MLQPLARTYHHASYKLTVVQQKPCAYPVCAAHGLVLNSTDIASYSSSQCIQNLHTQHLSAILTGLPTGDCI